MSLLKHSDIKMNWLLAYVGVFKDLISPQEALMAICDKGADDDAVRLVEEFYSNAEESKSDLIEFINQKFNFSENDLKEAESVWARAYLNRIYYSNKTNDEKLKEIARVWAMFGYPSDWRDFIYYMPVPDNVNYGADAVYERFVWFIKS